MSAVAPEIREAFTKFANPGPLLYVWVFDPQSGEAEVHDADGNVLDGPSHHELAEKYPHPNRLHGYAHRIIGGWRVTDWDDQPIDDPYVKRKVEEALRTEQSIPDLS